MKLSHLILLLVSIIFLWGCKKAKDVTNVIKIEYQGKTTFLSGGHYFSGSLNGGASMIIESANSYTSDRLDLSIQIEDELGNEIEIIGNHKATFDIIEINDNSLYLDSTIVTIESQEFIRLKGCFVGYLNNDAIVNGDFEIPIKH